MQKSLNQNGIFKVLALIAWPQRLTLYHDFSLSGVLCACHWGRVGEKCSIQNCHETTSTFLSGCHLPKVVAETVELNGITRAWNESFRRRRCPKRMENLGTGEEVFIDKAFFLSCGVENIKPTNWSNWRGKCPRVYFSVCYHSKSGSYIYPATCIDDNFVSPKLCTHYCRRVCYVIWYSSEHSYSIHFRVHLNIAIVFISELLRNYAILTFSYFFLLYENWHNFFICVFKITLGGNHSLLAFNASLHDESSFFFLS